MSKNEAFDAMDRLCVNYINEKDQDNCVMLVNGKRFKQRSNIVVFESQAKALNALRNAMHKHFRWRRDSYRNFMNAFEAWVEERVVFVSPEEYYRAKRKMRESGT
jgi:hypothetical protein